MTIPTTQNVVNDTKKTAADLEAVYVTVTPAKSPASAKPAPLPMKRRNSGGCLKICLVFLIVVALASASLGSYYLYRSFNPNRKSYKGRCSVPVQSTSTANLTLKEDVDVSTDLEKIKVPKFDNNDEATFIHDFKQKISVIKDDTDKVCYMLPLDTERIPPPETFLDLLYGITSGQYIMDADRIRSNYVVVHPAFDEAEVEMRYGSYIAGECAGYKSHELNEMDDNDIATTTTMATYRLERRFIMYPGGPVLMQYIIYN